VDRDSINDADMVSIPNAIDVVFVLVNKEEKKKNISLVMDGMGWDDGLGDRMDHG
jgi:hypothetical protein